MKTNAEHGQKGETLKMGKNSKQRGRKTEIRSRRRRRRRRRGRRRRRIECMLIEKHQRAGEKAKRRDMSEFIKNISRVNRQTPGHASTTKHYIKKQPIPISLSLSPALSLSLTHTHTHRPWSCVSVARILASCIAAHWFVGGRHGGGD